MRAITSIVISASLVSTCFECGRSELELREPAATDAAVPVTAPDTGTDAAIDAADGSDDAPPPLPNARWLAIDDGAGWSGTTLIRVGAGGFEKPFSYSGTAYPRWSPDGRHVALHGNGINLVSIEQDVPTGPVPVSQSLYRFGWSSELAIGLANDNAHQHWLLLDARGQSPIFHELDLGEPALPSIIGFEPVWAPDAHRVVLFKLTGYFEYQAYLLDVTAPAPAPQTLQSTAITSLGYSCNWSRDSRWLVCNGHAPWQLGAPQEEQLYYIDTQAPIAEPKLVPGSVDADVEYAVNFPFAASGWLLFTTHAEKELMAIRIWTDAQASAPIFLHSPAEPIARWRLSPDGHWLAYAGPCAPGAASALCVRQLSDAPPSDPIVVATGDFEWPQWSPNGRYLMFHDGSASGFGMWVDFSGGAPSAPQPLPQTESSSWLAYFSPDSDWLAYDPAGSAVGDLRLWRIGTDVDLLPFAESFSFVVWASDARSLAAMHPHPGGGADIWARFMTGTELTPTVVHDGSAYGSPGLHWQPVGPP